ncbi:MAG: stalk domain-containing protein, partial [Tumebacillaceae bacterium]
RTMVPVRFIAEAFGNKVTWDERGRVVIEGGGQAPNVRVIGADSYGLKEGQATKVQELLRTQNIVAQVEKEAGLSFQKPVWLYLTNSDSGYKQAIATYGDRRDADAVNSVSEGVTYGNTIILPLHRNADKPSDLPMTVAHELLHVLLNQNGGSDLPAWVHEGLAWQTGLDAAYAGQSPLLRRTQDAMMRDYVLDIVKNGEYQPLIDDHEATLDALDAAYNVELQDYFAYRYLIEQQGQAKFSAYLKSFTSGDSAAFQHSFGLTPAAFESQFKRDLDQEAAKTSRGVAITIQVPANFPAGGTLSITTEGAGEQRERDLVVGPGRHTLNVYKDGRIDGVETVPGEYIAEQDEQAAFLTMRLKTAQKANGIDAREGGFVLYDSFGESMLSSVWVHDLQQQDHYSEADKLFGVEILDVQTIR